MTMPAKENPWAEYKSWGELTEVRTPRLSGRLHHLLETKIEQRDTKIDTKTMGTILRAMREAWEKLGYELREAHPQAQGN
jgi:hypothetical protein